MILKLKIIKFLLSYSTRSLYRNQRRSFLTMLTIAACVFISFISLRYAIAIMDLWKQGAFDTGIGHFQVYKSGYLQRTEGIKEKFCIEENNPLEQQFKSDLNIKAYSKRITFEGLAVSDTGSGYFIGIAIDPKLETKVSPSLFNPEHDLGEFVPQINSATIGKGISKILGVSIGDTISIVAHTAKGSVNAIDLVIKGIVDVPLPSFSKRVIYLNLTDAQKLLRLPNKYTELAVKITWLEDMFSIMQYYEPIIKKLNYEMRGWWQIDPIIKKAEKIWYLTAMIFCILLFTSAIITVMNVIFMIVNERIVEIGTLKAIGAQSGIIRLVFCMEGMWLGFGGALLGMIVSIIVILIFNYYGIPFNSPFGGGIVRAYPTINIFWVLIFITIVSIGCALCAIPPAFKAAKVDPVLAFRNQLN